MTIIGIIPARYQSTRFPGKPLADIMGKSMVQRVYEQASQSASLTDVVVATDDDRILKHVQEFGGQVVMTSRDHQSGTDRCDEVVNLLQDLQRRDALVIAVGPLRQVLGDLRVGVAGQLGGAQSPAARAGSRPCRATATDSPARSLPREKTMRRPVHPPSPPLRVRM